MKVAIDLRMATGNGENSYAANSRLQTSFSAYSQRTIDLGACRRRPYWRRPVLLKAIEELYGSLPPRSTMVVADLGCSSGPNTLLVLSEAMGAIHACWRDQEPEEEERQQSRAVEVQFFLNDLPGNDFNLVFRSLDCYSEKLLGVEEEEETPPCYYVAGLPGSYYGMLFPSRSVHLFHSSYSLMWRSKVPEELSCGTLLNEGNIYIGKTTPHIVIKLFQEQFQKDFDLFLTFRSKELVSGARMLLTFLGRKHEEMLMHGEISTMFELLAKSLLSLVLKGRMEQEKLDSFNLPYYAPSVREVTTLININKHFDIEHIGLFESNWDPQDDSNSDIVLDCHNSGENVAKCVRGVLAGLLIIDHFGEDTIDELFVVFASILTKHLVKAKAKHTVIFVSLTKGTH
ncbi:hypothetical protein BRADI_4g16110v3 [Brachypodium distachyon]|uniref:Jasmonate O-methyltransferase n=1 Tax=Brachypodium distachyon TaxID=15368 RepID=A0A0Q3EPF3_BRADI|nr:hypothetical protein BRADI_4g16110v3 [Brachypodium distachyon]